MTVGLLVLAGLIVHVASNLSHGQAVEVPAARMLADWQELQRLAREHPYREQSDRDGCR